MGGSQTLEFGRMRLKLFLCSAALFLTTDACAPQPPSPPPTSASTTTTTTTTTTTPVTPGFLARKSLSEYPEALCNDGTNASYYFSYNAFNSDKLLIYLQGGGGRTSVDECNRRCDSQVSGHYCTTMPDEALEQEKLIEKYLLSDDEQINPPFFDFGKIFVPYCSSDTWIGTADANAENGGYNFHGKDIVRAVVDDVKMLTNLGEKKQIVLYGISAGGFGIQSVCDFAADSFKAENPSLDVRCIADSGDFVPPVGQECKTEEESEALGKLWGVELDESCIAAGGKCGNFVNLYSFIETPFFVAINYADPIVSGDCPPNANAFNIEYWNQWRQEIKSMAKDVLLAKPDSGFFIPNCFFHVLATREDGWSKIEVPLDGSNKKIVLKDILKNWLTGAGPSVALMTPYSQIQDAEHQLDS